ncbi:hypothetical protein C3747_40g171 [Trypanosoma cruzi]|uniref:Uncharacterized protein n=2 Tax=Trypanosoma cruzi TaxID=5693 RepID=Q4DP67_TRYCC|nr:hypothetical protein, conserved [Trypanosoma cruzi]EAN94315.1 hypothetical protein, conserved [Trypanosoma cruzi]PWV13965.1 hypothetical protein C3747_40g171 [Trypanosoma cruzi]|eukprot:XP_816166.1 hypothetical protein [Trypanosoma cruzi strain CL Brener]
MNLTDEDSSTYHSHGACTPISPSRTPEWQPVASEQNLDVFPSSASPVRSLSSSASSTAEAQRKKQKSPSVRSNDGEIHQLEFTMHPLPDLSIQGRESTKAGHLGLSNGERTDEHPHSGGNDDGTSSIEFAIDDESFRESKSPILSGFQFVQNPSVTFREASAPPQCSGGDGDAKRTAEPSNKHGTNLANVYENNKYTQRRGTETKKKAKEMLKISPWHLEEKTMNTSSHTGQTSVESGSLRHSGETEGDIQGANRLRRKEKVEPRSQWSGRGSCASKKGERRSSHGEKSNSSLPAVPTRSASDDNRPRRRQVSNGTSSVRSHSSDFTPKRSLRASPRRGRAFLYPCRVQESASMPRTHSAPLRAVVANSPALDRLRRRRTLESSQRGRIKEKEDILAMLDDEMENICNQVREYDMITEYEMLRSPFERLYHMNNRRDRDERRCRIYHYMKLEEAKKRLMAETEESAARRRERLLKREQRREEFFDRLYCTTPNRVNNSQLNSFQTTRSGASAVNNALFQRLYNEGVQSMAEKREKARRAELNREQKELEEALHARILARLELNTPPGRLLTPREREVEAENIKHKLIQDPNQLREYLKTSRLSKEEEDAMAWRLSRQGYNSAAKLAKQKEEKELRGCTFHPTTNKNFIIRGGWAAARYSKATVASLSRVKKDESKPSPANSPQRSGSRIQKVACEQLYMKALKQRERQKTLVEEADKQKRLSLLKAKLKEDHHFRRRVELDPSLAQRFMASLVV